MDTEDKQNEGVARPKGKKWTESDKLSYLRDISEHYWKMNQLYEDKWRSFVRVILGNRAITRRRISDYDAPPELKRKAIRAYREYSHKLWKRGYGLPNPVFEAELQPFLAAERELVAYERENAK